MLLHSKKPYNILICSEGGNVMVNAMKPVLIAILIIGSLGTIALYWFYGMAPARDLAQLNVNSISLSSGFPELSLYDLRFKASSCYPPKKGDSPEHVCDLKKEEEISLVKQALKKQSRSYYLSKPPVETEKINGFIYVISIKTDGQYYILCVSDLEQEKTGRFYGYQQPEGGIETSEIKWFVYENPELGKVLKSLRTAS